MPSLISGDDQAQLTTSYSMTQVVVDNVDSRGVWRRWDQHQKNQTFRVEGARLISDRWQTGLTLPILQRSFAGRSSAGLGDVSATIGYEILPDWDYNPYRPKGISFVQLTLPTGRSRAESETGGMDSRGNGFWALGVGSLFTKAVGKYDLFSSFDLHRSFEKSISTTQVQGKLTPGWGGHFALGAGYNTKTLRFGSSVTWNYEDAVRLESGTSSTGSPERFATATFSTSYMASDEWAGTLSYSDQTLFGSPVNTSLGRSLALSLQRRWGR